MAVFHELLSKQLNPLPKLVPGLFPSNLISPIFKNGCPFARLTRNVWSVTKFPLRQIKKPRGVLQISGDGDQVLGGLKFSTPGFLGVGKFGKWIDLSMDFFLVFKTISRLVVVPAYDNFRWYDEETNTNIQFISFNVS